MLTVDRKQFLAALDTVSRAATKSSLPILSSVQIAPQTDGTLALTCTDLYTAITAVVAYEGVASGPACGAEVKVLVDRTKRLPNGHARLAWTTPERPDATGRLTVADGPRSYQLRSLPESELPPVPRAEGAREVLVAPASTLARALDRVLYAVCVDETRPGLNSVRVEIKGRTLRLVATDGHRLAMHDAPITSGVDTTMLLSLSALTHMRRMLDAKRRKADAPVTIAVDTANAYVRVPGVATLATRIVDDKFPPYEQVIPARAGMARHVTVDRARLADAVKAVAVASPVGTVTLTMHANAIHVHAESEDGSADERLAACRITAAASTVADVRIGVHARYLLDACDGTAAETLCLSTSGELDPILVTSIGEPTTIAVVMPVRLR